jgi:hypothetical protein
MGQWQIRREGGGVMATKLEEKGCNGRIRKEAGMATKLRESAGNGRTRRKGGHGRSRSTTSESQEQGTRNDN